MEPHVSTKLNTGPSLTLEQAYRQLDFLYLSSVDYSFFGRPLHNYPQTTQAVSYTHLDVYKRQIVTTVLWLRLKQ